MFGTHTEHPWQSARDDFDKNVLPVLEKHGKAIGAAANNGDAKAKLVIERYTLLHRSFDPMTLTLLKKAMQDLDGDAKLAPDNTERTKHVVA